MLTLAALTTSFAALAIVVRAVSLIVLYRTLHTTENALLCAGLYTLAAAIGDLLFSKPLGEAFVHALIGFARIRDHHQLDDLVARGGP